jgi:flagellar hook protein FlgE
LVQGEGTTFLAGLNSGDAEIGAAGSGGRGSIASSHLEASNVDMAQEFTNMILAQRGFQASSRVITTSDEILQELVNLKR